MRTELLLGVAVHLSATVGVFALQPAPVSANRFCETTTQSSELHERFAATSTSGGRQQSNSDNAAFRLKGFYLGMPIKEAQKLAKKVLPDSLVVITTNNCIEIDVNDA